MDAIDSILALVHAQTTQTPAAEPQRSAVA